jgi:hypothetical protein
MLSRRTKVWSILTEFPPLGETVHTKSGLWYTEAEEFASTNEQVKHFVLYTWHTTGFAVGHACALNIDG